jgi:hypothetical protein
VWNYDIQGFSGIKERDYHVIVQHEMVGNKFRKPKLRNKNNNRRNAQLYPSKGTDYDYQNNTGEQHKNNMLVSL